MSSKRNSSSASNSLTFNDALPSSVLLHQQRLIATPTARKSASVACGTSDYPDRLPCMPCSLPNHTERSLRGISIGRHNWTFVGSDRGGKTMAVLRSFVASCELAKVDPFAWFQDVLIRIGECSMQQLDELLPHRWAAARHWR